MRSLDRPFRGDVLVSRLRADMDCQGRTPFALGYWHASGMTCELMTTSGEVDWESLA